MRDDILHTSVTVIPTTRIPDYVAIHHGRSVS